MSESTRQQLFESLEQLIAQGKKETIKSVADNAGLSHSVIYNRYPELKSHIKKAQEDQEAQQERLLDKETINRLKTKLASAKTKVSSSKNEQDVLMPILLAHLSEVYSMCDQLAEERDELARQLKVIKGGDLA